MTWVVAALAAAVAWLLVAPDQRLGLRRLSPPRVPSARGRPVLLAVALLPLAWFALGPRWSGWLLAGAIGAGTVSWLVRRSAAEKRARAAAIETARAAATMSLLLRSGQIPTVALAEAAADCPSLAPAARAQELGGDVAGSLLAAAATPGQHGLARMAAAWQVSAQTGAPIADVMSQVAQTLGEEQQLADTIAVELSAARASSRIMAALPLAALGLGVLVGANPLGFLFGETLGEVLFVTGVALAALGVVWIERLTTRLTPGGPG